MPPANANPSTADSLPVPPLNLAANFECLQAELTAELNEVATSGYYVLGPKVTAFEEHLASYCGVRHAVGVSSGTDALLISLMALNIGHGDEVIVPTFTFFATAGTVHRLGARSVFCDIDPETYNLDVTRIEKLITPRTKAIIPVHLYGQMADMPALLEVARQHNLAIVEDAAQAIGARTRDGDSAMAGSFGDFGALSFYPTKNLGALGDAGAVLTNNEQMDTELRKLRIHGSGHTYYHDRVGGNFRIDALQAALLNVKLGHLEIWTEQRRARAAYYSELLEATGLCPARVRPPNEVYGRHVYHQYVIRAQRRDDLAAFLKQRKIGCGIYYPVPMHLQKCFASYGYQPGDFPHAEAAAAEVLALPIYPELTELQQKTVVAGIAEFYRC
ncbi:MAG: DegT/DnrJ/EryC1/StrS family aminotransferase [Planctomycetota bacterium]